jgi:membrane-anchored glycerophosphoryl diester phosphodiesterase (GDPDase)
MIPSMFFIMAVSLVVFALYLAASIHAAMQANLSIQITFREAYGVAWKRIGRYLWLLFLIYIIAFLPMLVMELVMFVPMQLLAMGKSGPLTPLVFMIPLGMLLFIAALVYGVIIAMRLSLAFPASLAEDLTARAALRRSGQLTQGAKGRIFLVLLVIYAFGYAAEMVGIFALAAVIGIGALAMAACGVQMPSVAGILGIVLASLCFAAFFFLWAALLWSAFSTSFAVLYHDQRLRKEVFLAGPSQAGELA